jgi:hypothetical protein
VEKFVVHHQAYDRYACTQARQAGRATGEWCRGVRALLTHLKR